MYYKKTQILIILTSVLFSPLTMAADATSTATSTSTATTTEAVKITPQSINELSAELVALKDDTSLPEGKKAIKELELRKKILEGVIFLSYEELDKLSGRLDSLEKLNEAEKTKVASSTEILGSFRKHYDAVKDKLALESTIDGTKQIASELKDWRESEYILAMKEIFNFAQVIQLRRVVNIGFERRSKIEADINKLFQSGYITKEQNDELMKMLENAKLFLDSAQAANNDAYKIIFENSSSPDEFIKASLEKIKSAYSIFLDMSAKVKEIIGL